MDKKYILLISIIMFIVTLSFLVISNDISFSDGKAKIYDSANKEVKVKDNFGLGDDIATIKLIKNTDVCFVNCSAEGIINLNKKGSLIDSLRFEKEIYNDRFISKKVSYKIYINKSSQIIDVINSTWKDCSKEQILPNGSITKTCKYEYSTRKDKKIIWELYNGQELSPGNYTWRIEGQKKPEESIEWIPTFAGIEVNEWALWSSASGIVSYWAFDNNLNGYNATQDATGHSHNLSTNSGTPLYNSTVQVVLGQSINCDEGDSVKIANKSDLNLGNNATLSMWFYTTAQDDRYAPIIRWYNLGVSDFAVYFEPTGELKVVSNGLTLSNNSVITMNAWHNIVLQLKSSGNLTLWIDGLIRDSGVGAGNWDLSMSPTIRSLCGPNDDNAWYHGYLDEVGIWNKTLSDSDVNYLYSSGSAVLFGTENFFVNLTSPKNATSQTSKQVVFNCSSNGGNNKISNVSLWLNSSGAWHKNMTLDYSSSNNISLNSSFKVNLTDYRNYTWNCMAWNNETIPEYRIAQGNFSITLPDLTSPNISILSPPASVSTATILLNFSIDDNVALSNCSYNITRGASVEKANKDLNISKKPYVNATYTLSGEATYQVNLRCIDTSGRINVTNKTFGYSTASPGTPGGGGGGTVFVGGEKGWSMEVSNGISNYDINMLSGTSRTLNIQFENLGDESRQITFGCEDIEGSICNYIEFPRKTFSLALLKDTKQIEKFTINLPKDVSNGNYRFNIRAVDDLSRAGDITVFLSVGGEGLFNAFYTRLISSTTNGFPYLIIFIIILIPSIIISSIFLGKYKIPLRPIWVVIISITLSTLAIYIL